MLSNISRRPARLAFPRTLALLHAQSQLQSRFHTSPVHLDASVNTTEQPPRMPARRVKTPWIEALTKARQEANAAGEGLQRAEGGGQQQPQAARAKVDLEPKRMGDSFYRVVCLIPSVYHEGGADGVGAASSAG